ncbi:NnrS family protein [Thiogranum longum]|uniref:NnrS family protein n=1 Tax=Thiogranum longum TaxID=1537524 RepID=UPI001FB47102|nr:NnrS family protein [Thiogranum longum]
MLQIEESTPRGVAWLRLGFRPFFLAALAFGAISMLIWLGVFGGYRSLPLAGLSGMVWHGHEMIYGYSMAVIAGFLLTAVRNWTGVATLRGIPLLLLFLCWLLARLLLAVGDAAYLYYAAVFDLLFNTGFLVAIAVPVMRTRSWAQAPILLKAALMAGSNLLFYLGAGGALESGIVVGLFSGLYLVLALILMLSRRVLPFFIERGVGYAVQLSNRKWLDISSVVLFVAFWLADIFRPDSLPVSLLAIALLVLHAMRWVGWYTPGIWKKPLLWSLYLAYGAIIAGFALKAAVYFLDLSPYLALHAFAVGGVGLMTAGMMSRVALGHTGRDIMAPPAVLTPVFLLLVAALLARVALPMIDVSHYRLWVVVSQGLWIVAFSVLTLRYFPILTQPRIDGQDG